jgi:hypothetical protein
MSIKTITMTWSDQNGGHVSYTQAYDRDCCWSAISHQFQNFLLSMGYRLDGEAVGSDVGEFVVATENNEEMF